MQEHTMQNIENNVEAFLIASLLRAEGEVAAAFDASRQECEAIQGHEERIRRIRAAIAALEGHDKT